MNTGPNPQRAIGRIELIALISLTMAVTALSIDLMLPAFGEIRSDFGMDPDSPEAAAIVTAFMIGLAVAQVFYGPFADRFGRKPVLYVSFCLYTLGAIFAAVAPSFGLLLAGRALWGIGAAGPRVLTLAIVRDTHEGDEMARVMSLIMAVFILVPVMAPSLGAALITFLPWRGLFWFCVVYLGAIALWAIRLPETLDPRDRIDLDFGGIRRAAAAVISQRRAMAYALAMMILFGSFVSYLATSELIVADVFDLEDQFPLIFGGFAGLMGIGALANARIVRRFGSRRMVGWIVTGYLSGAASLLLIALLTSGRPGFWLVVPFLAVALGSYALLIPNLNTLAMEPMGAVAGTAAALIGTAQTGGGAILGAFVDRAYDGTITPFAFAMVIAAVLALALTRWAGSDRAATAPAPPSR